jgi:hypothetical protein
MKKLLLILFLSSCGYESQDNLKYNIVTETGTSSIGACYYVCTGSRTGAFSELLSETRFQFYDSCGKYTVGDTVKIVKY